MSDVVTHACDTSIWVLEARESDVQDHFVTYTPPRSILAIRNSFSTQIKIIQKQKLSQET